MTYKNTSHSVFCKEQKDQVDEQREGIHIIVVGASRHGVTFVTHLSINMITIYKCAQFIHQNKLSQNC